MSRRIKRFGLIGNLKNLAGSLLFRRLTIWWSVLLGVLMVSVTAIVTAVIRTSYETAEIRLAEQSIDSVASIRELYVSGAIDREGSHILQRQIFSDDSSTFFFFRPNIALIMDGEGVQTSDITSPELAQFLPYVEELGEGRLEARSVKLYGHHFIIAGRHLEYESAPDESLIVLRDTELFYKEFVLVILLLIGFILLVIFIGILIIVTLTNRYVYPFTELAKAAVEMSEGNLDARVAPADDGSEIGMLIRLFNRVGESLKSSFRQIEGQRSLLEKIDVSSTNGIAVIDENGILIRHNPALDGFFPNGNGGTAAEGRDGRLGLIPDPDLWQRFDEVAASGVSSSFAYPIDNERVLWVSIAPIVTNEGRRMGAVGNFNDMTEVERLERTRRDYVANVSHELRRPLTALQGLLEPIRDGLVTEEADRQRYYDIMLSEIKRLTRLIADMMQISGLQSGNITFNNEIVDVSDIVCDVAERYRAGIEADGLSLEVTAPQGMMAEVDPDRLEQVLVILLDNAHKFNNENGNVWISSSYSEDGGASVVVSNTGFGIDEEDVPHIFERFYTSKVAPVNGSNGLGLSIAKTIMEKMGGSISCESTLGGITYMRLDFAPVDPDKREEA